jgi:hypothetical protein
MTDIYDIRRNILLRVPIDALAEACQTDKLAQKICNSSDFWEDRYTRDGVGREQFILYQKSVNYLGMIFDNLVLLANIDVSDIDEEAIIDPDLREIMDNVFSHVWGLTVTVILRYRTGFHIDSGIMHEEIPGYETTHVEEKQMLKFIQFLLLAKIPITIMNTLETGQKATVQTASQFKFIA